MLLGPLRHLCATAACSGTSGSPLPKNWRQPASGDSAVAIEHEEEVHSIGELLYHLLAILCMIHTGYAISTPYGVTVECALATHVPLVDCALDVHLIIECCGLRSPLPSSPLSRHGDASDC